MISKKSRRREYIRQFYRGNRMLWVVAMVQTGIISGANLMISWLLQVIVDISVGNGGRYTLGQTVVLSGVCMGVIIFSMWLEAVSKPRLIANAISRYKEFVFQKISRKGIAAFSGENTSFYISALSNDTNTLENEYLGNVFELASQVLMFLGAIGLMLWYSPLLTAIGIALALLPVAASFLAGNRVAKAEEQVSRQNDAYMSALHDGLAGFPVVKVFRAETVMQRLFSQKVRTVAEAKIRRGKADILVACMGAVAGVTVQMGVFIAGTALILNGFSLSPGALMAFVNLMNLVVNPIGTVPRYLAQRKAGRGLIDKLAEALEENIRQEGTEIVTDLKKGIAVENLSFSYDGETRVLQDISFCFEAGKSYAVVGASGSGKSTLLNLLMAAHAGYSGAITYDGTDLRQIGSESLYTLVSMVQQNVFIFNASIRDNITMFSEFPREETDRAIRLSGLSAVIARRGEDYLCGENGSNLSGGEKQRISIARSLLKKSRVLLADEATAALDARTAFQVSSGILDLEGLTRIVVTHALDENLLKRYDCVLTLRNGRIAESGSFRELMDRKGYFYSLFTVSQ